MEKNRRTLYINAFIDKIKKNKNISGDNKTGIGQQLFLYKKK